MNVLTRDHDFGSWVTSQADDSACRWNRRADRGGAGNTRLDRCRRGGHDGLERHRLHHPTIHCGRGNHRLYGGFQDLIDRSLASSGLINVSLPAATGLSDLTGNSGVFVGTTQVGNCYDNSSTSPSVHGGAMPDLRGRLRRREHGGFGDHRRRGEPLGGQLHTQSVDHVGHHGSHVSQLHGDRREVSQLAHTFDRSSVDRRRSNHRLHAWFHHLLDRGAFGRPRAASSTCHSPPRPASVI